MHLVNTGKPGAPACSPSFGNGPKKLLATVLLGNNLVNTARRRPWQPPSPSALIDSTNLAILIATVTITLLLLVFGEILPKTVAWRRAEVVAFALSRPPDRGGMGPLARDTPAPGGSAIWSAGLLGITARRFSGYRGGHPGDDLRGCPGRRGGTHRGGAAGEGCFHFGDRQVQEIMTPRIEIAWVEKGATLADFLKAYSQETHTRFPVYEGDY